MKVYTKVTSGMEMKMARGRFLGTESGVSASVPGAKMEVVHSEGTLESQLHLPRGQAGTYCCLLFPQTPV